MKKLIAWGVISLLLHSQSHAVAEPTLPHVIAEPTLPHVIAEPTIAVETLTASDKLNLLKDAVPSIKPQLFLGISAALTSAMAALCFALIMDEALLRKGWKEKQSGEVRIDNPSMLGYGIFGIIMTSLAVVSAYQTHKKRVARNQIKKRVENVQHTLLTQIYPQF